MGSLAATTAWANSPLLPPLCYSSVPPPMGNHGGFLFDNNSGSGNIGSSAWAGLCVPQEPLLLDAPPLKPLESAAVAEGLRVHTRG